jgi:hypothetical protein
MKGPAQVGTPSSTFVLDAENRPADVGGLAVPPL